VNAVAGVLNRYVRFQGALKEKRQVVMSFLKLAAIVRGSRACAANVASVRE
jgi:hypothetical protein